MNEHGELAPPGNGGPRMRRIKVGPEERPHWCFPLTDPKWLTATQADHMRPDDPVLGIEVGDGHWALPWWIMKNHHICNTEFNGRPYLVNLCEVCSAAAAFDPVIDGRRYTFCLGGIYNGTIMPQDYETGSLWTGFSGEAIEGPLTGRKLERLPLLQCTWEEWVAMHPDTLVADGTGESRVGHGEGRAPGSPWIGPDMGDLLAKLDTRLPHYELVLGVLVGGEGRCYPLAALAEARGVVNDSLNGTDLLVISRPGTWLASAFSRAVDGQLLTFEPDEAGARDRETGSGWSVSGRCVRGPMEGKQLRYLHSGVEEFFIWAAFHPKTGIHAFQSTAAGPQPQRWTATDAVPTPIYAALRSKWIKRGSRLLDVACGDGMIAALLAEMGMRVVAIDPDEANVRRAQSNFRGVENLEIRHGSLRTLAEGTAPFDAVVDHGSFARLPAPQRKNFVRKLHALTAPGAKLLMLQKTPKDRLEQRRANVAAIFAPEFVLIDARPTTLPDHAIGAFVDGAVFRLERGPT